MGWRLAVWAASCKIPRTQGEPCLSVGEVGVNGPPPACLDWSREVCRLRGGGQRSCCWRHMVGTSG